MRRISSKQAIHLGTHHGFRPLTSAVLYFVRIPFRNAKIDLSDSQALLLIRCYCEARQKATCVSRTIQGQGKLGVTHHCGRKKSWTFTVNGKPIESDWVSR